MCDVLLEVFGSDEYYELSECDWVFFAMIVIIFVAALVIDFIKRRKDK